AAPERRQWPAGHHGHPPGAHPAGRGGERHQGQGAGDHRGGRASWQRGHRHRALRGRAGPDRDRAHGRSEAGSGGAAPLRYRPGPPLRPADGARALTTLPAAPTPIEARPKKEPPALPRLPFLEREAPLGYVLVLPAVLYLAVFIAYPFLMAIWL